MRAETSTTPTFSPAPPPRPVRPRRAARPRPAPGTEAAAVAPTRHPAQHPDRYSAGHPAQDPAGYLVEHPADNPRSHQEARRLTLAAFAVAATALLMPFTALVSLALATVGHAKGDRTLGQAALLTALAAMAAGFVLNLTVIDVMF